MIIINSPHNPTGAVLDKSDLLALEKIVRNTNIIVLSDEVYEHIVFDGNENESVMKYPHLFHNSLAIFSFGKTFHATGWKVGYCIAPEHLMHEFKKVHQFNVFSVNTPVQHALADYLKKPKRYLSLPDFYQKKRDLFSKSLKESRFDLLPCSGTYFQLASFRNISDKSDMEFAEVLAKKYGVAAIPMSAFYNTNIDNGILRFCFAKENDTLKEAGNILTGI